jgi:diacylglycerol kinase (ATP)
VSWRDGVWLVILAAVSVLAVARFVVARRGRAASAAPAASPEPMDAGEVTLERPWAAVVANPTKVGDVAARTAWLQRACASLGWGPPLWLETTADDAGGGPARAALQAGAHAVLAFGGDGTVRAVAAELAGSGVPLGILPAGTGNLLARNLGLPSTDLDAALWAALSGPERKIDVAVAEIDVSGEDHTPRSVAFMVMAGLGFDAEVMAAVEPRLKERMGWWAYVVVGTKNLRGPRTKVAIRMDDGEPLHRRVRSVIVGNCGELTGGVRLLPAAEVDDGWLDLVVLAPRGVAGWAAVTATVLTRSRYGHPIVERFRCRRVELRAAKPLHVQLDGDPVGQARVLRARVDEHALVVRVPEGQG